METLHPKIVHFPIAMLFLAGAFYILHLFIKNQRLDRFGFILHLGGTLGTVAAIISGNYAESTIVQTEAIHHIVEEHEFLGMLTGWSFGILLVWAYLRQRSRFLIERISFAIIFAACLGILIIGASHGGQLVYEYGAGVKPMEKHLIDQRNLDQESSVTPDYSDDD